MYDELIRSCRACATGYEGNCDNCMFSGEDCYKQLHKASADAIEELSRRIERAVDLYNRNVEKSAMYEALAGISPEAPKDGDGT